MSLRINQNIDALNSYRNLSVTQGQMSKSLEKLSSGFRINRAADDAAGLAISEGLRSQVGGLKVAVRNAQDGVSVVQTAEGALTEIHSILQRMRDLAVQAANDCERHRRRRRTSTTEVTSSSDELDRIAEHDQVQRHQAARRQLQRQAFQVGLRRERHDPASTCIGRPARRWHRRQHLGPAATTRPRRAAAATTRVTDGVTATTGGR